MNVMKREKLLDLFAWAVGTLFTLASFVLLVIAVTVIAYVSVGILDAL